MAPRSSVHDPQVPRLRLLSGADVRVRPTLEDDQRLVAAFESGAPEAGGRLYDRLYPVVDATLVRILGGRLQDHPDLVQSAFEQIVATLSRRTFARGCTLVGWAAVLACHVGLNALRARRRERVVIGPERPFEGAIGLDGQIDARDGLLLVRRHLSEMDEARVTTLLLHAMGHDLTEIAALTKTSVAAAQSRLSRGRRELKARIEGEVAARGHEGRGS